jgi:putative tryptophan/tyrosine transport system substrate-binding protein
VLLSVGLSARAQHPVGKVYRLGVLTGTSATSPPLKAFQQGLRELGWIEGQNILVEYRFAHGEFKGLPAHATELVGLKVDVIAAGPTPPAMAAKRATQTIPIVMLGAADPVELGLVASLAQPGGNVTGLAWSVDLKIIAKGLELLKEIIPKIRHVAILWYPANPAQTRAIEELQRAAQSLGVELHLTEARGSNDLDGAYATIAEQQVQAVLVVPEAFFVEHRARLAELEAKYRLPSMHGLRPNFEAGGLISYGPSITDVWGRAASFVDKILKGAKPADLPVEQPTKYELLINLKTAKALGLTMPQSLLLRADEVIE